jgi:tyrosyl-tRNA synthetase
MERAIRESQVNPRDLKMRLARDIVAQFHGADAANQAQAEFVQVFQKHELPTDMPTFAMKEQMNVIDLMLAAQVAPSRSEARRLVTQGGVRLDDAAIEKIDAIIPARDAVLRVGRRKFVRLIAG